MSKLSAQEIAARKIETILIELDRTSGLAEMNSLCGGRINISKPGVTGYLVTIVLQSVWDRYSAA
jgi:hypothetical protein